MVYEIYKTLSIQSISPKIMVGAFPEKVGNPQKFKVGKCLRGNVGYSLKSMKISGRIPGGGYNRRYRIRSFCNVLWYWKGDKTKENPTGKMIMS